MKELQLLNRQRDRTIDRKLLRAITVALLEGLLGLSDYELAVHFVSEPRMAGINSDFLHHEGSTDVITFDLREGYESAGTHRQLAGEIYVCVKVAEKQAEEFGTSVASELVRYITHGVLHLTGYDDLTPGKRKRMKREENRLVNALERRFEFSNVTH